MKPLLTLYRIKKEERSNLVHPYPTLGPEVLLPSMYLPERKPPQCPPSALPPDGNLTLSCVLDESVGNGSSGVVYGTKSQDVRGPAGAEVKIQALPSEDGYRLPQLVLKMGRQQRCANLAREAWFYEDMECLQGVAVPRCYGLFSAKIPTVQQSLLRPWNYESARDTDFMPSLNWRDPLLDSRLRALLSEHETLYVLVLEKLGGKLPINEPISDDLT